MIENITANFYPNLIILCNFLDYCSMANKFHFPLSLFGAEKKMILLDLVMSEFNLFWVGVAWSSIFSRPILNIYFRFLFYYEDFSTLKLLQFNQLYFLDERSICIKKYDAQQPDEMPLKLGDIVLVKVKHRDGWWKVK